MVEICSGIGTAPPFQINTYTVRGVCEHLGPIFEHFRNHLYLSEGPI